MDKGEMQVPLDFIKVQQGMMSHHDKLAAFGVTPRENMLMAYRHEIPFAVPSMFVDGALIVPAEQLDHYNGHGVGHDGWGVEWTYIPEEFSPMPTGKPLLEDICDWREVVKFPDLENFDWETQADLDMHCDSVATLSAGEYVALPNGGTFNDGDKCAVLMNTQGPFERLHALMGFEGALVALLENPEECFEFFSAVADYKIELFKKFNEHYPADIIMMHDDYGAQDRMFMSLETWRELLKPNLARIVTAVHEMGLYYEHHSCGYIEPLMPDFIDIGVDSLNTLQRACNHNLEELKRRYGSQLTFSGGFDNTGVFDRVGVTPDEVKAEYRYTLELLAPGGSYVATPIGLTFDQMPFELAQHFDMAFSLYGDVARA